MVMTLLTIHSKAAEYAMKTRAEFVAFARDYLGVDVIFWSVEAPWLAGDRTQKPRQRGRGFL